MATVPQLAKFKKNTQKKPDALKKYIKKKQL